MARGGFYNFFTIMRYSTLCRRYTSERLFTLIFDEAKPSYRKGGG